VSLPSVTSKSTPGSAVQSATTRQENERGVASLLILDSLDTGGGYPITLIFHISYLLSEFFLFLL
jgi:hypothetical protein